VLTILIASWAGQWVDGRVTWSHGWGVAVGFCLGVAAAIRNLILTARQMQRDIERAEALDPAAGRWTVDERWLHGEPGERPPEDAPQKPHSR
jgi:hypothetical protein